ncbi:MAG: hypothetical protein Q4B43_06715 [Bacteroidota bacterium]|nr:hypothetical protein [Bacteroidota bacterium]
MKKILFSLLAMVLLVGCRNDDTSVEQNVEYQTLLKGNDLHKYNDLSDNLTLVISNATEFEDFVSQVEFDTTDFPEVDYNESMVIVVLGKLNTLGSDYEILNIEEQGNFIKVNTKELVYDSAVMSKPFHVVKISKTNKTIIFN